MGIFFAFLAMVSWGFGDFLIQKSTRKFGNWIALFYITTFASIVLLPFVYKDIVELFRSSPILILFIGASLVILFAAILDFEALRIGKISVMEPIYALEVPITAGLAFLILKEPLNYTQMGLVISLLLGIILVSIRSFHQIRNITWEKGVAHAALATLGMGVANFLFGVGARATNPLLINWFTSLFMAIVCLCYLTSNGQLKTMGQSFKTNRKLILGVSFIDNFAWIAYSYSTLYIPIAIAISLTESYIALAAMLGLIFNKEKLKKHQFAGLIITVTSAIILAYLTG